MVDVVSTDAFRAVFRDYLDRYVVGGKERGYEKQNQSARRATPINVEILAIGKQFRELDYRTFFWDMQKPKFRNMCVH